MTLALACAVPATASAGYIEADVPSPGWGSVAVQYVPYLNVPYLGGIYDIPTENNDVLVSHSSRYAATIAERGALMLPQPTALTNTIRTCTLGLNTPTCRTSGSYWLTVRVFTGAGNDRVTVTVSAGVDAVHVDSGDGNDSVTGSSGNEYVTPGAGNDVVNAGAGNDAIHDPYDPSLPSGADTLNGGDGNDEIRARDGVRDQIQCGTGNDAVVADTLDVVAADCETVHYL